MTTSEPPLDTTSPPTPPPALPPERPARALPAAALLGPVMFALLFLVRAVNPIDPILAPIGVALVGATAFLATGRRLAGLVYLLFPIALFTSPAIQEISFNLGAIDSSAWRWHAVASLLALGPATATAVLVALRPRRPDGPVVLASIVAGATLGGLLLLAAPAVADHPSFGRDLSEVELAALPVIDLLNYRYDAAVITVEADGPQRFRLDNPTDVPHTVTIDAIDLEVWVPAGRWAVLEFDGGRLAESVAFYCSVGDHRDLGMSGLLEVA